MTSAEVNDWLRNHANLFPGFANWFKREATDQEATLAGWRAILSDVSLEAAQAASLQLARGEQKPPNGYSLHPAAVRTIAAGLDFAEKNKGPVYISGQETYSCPACLDSGYRLILHPLFIQWANGDRDRVCNMSAATGCSCQRGQRKAWLRQFDPANDIPFNPAWTIAEACEVSRTGPAEN